MSQPEIKEELTFDDVLIEPAYSEIESRNECELYQSLPLDLEIPIISANMDTITGVKMHDKMQDLGGAGILHRYLTLHDLIDIIEDGKSKKGIVYASVGSVASREEEAKINYLMQCHEYGIAKVILCVDMAHGHSLHMKKTLLYIKDNSTLTTIAGNVVTERAVKDLYEWGADIIKVGIGAGSVCSTRVQTGCGKPQLQAIIDCSRVQNGTTGHYIPIIADGGLRTPGDCAKALAAGATYIMIGGMLAGTDCTPYWDEFGGNLLYRGMASKEAKFEAGKDPNFIEGVNRTVQRKDEGSTQKVIKDICEGVKSAMSYVGALDLKQFRERAVPIRISRASQVENAPHFLQI